jgi:hypothetical protein
MITIYMFLFLGLSLSTVNHLDALIFQLQGYLMNKYPIMIECPIFLPSEKLFLCDIKENK